jgi:protein TonB
MEKGFKKNPTFDDIVFEIRNKEYGAYILRKKYSGYVTLSILIGIIIISTAIITPYLNAKALEKRQHRTERQVEIKLENLDQPDQAIVPPPPPPPPPTDVVQQVKYIPPVVVDSVKPEDTQKLMTADEAQVNVKNDDPVEVKEVKEEVQEKESEPEPFLYVEEMPVPPGGVPGLYKYIAEHTQYPEIARENNIQGKVYVRFCVTAKGTVEQVSILKGVDPSLDAEAIRVVRSFPKFTPGKQAGIPVPVWFNVYINFQLN